MGFVEHVVLPPSAQHFGLIPVMLYLMALVHLAFIGMVLISSGLSLVARRFSAPLADTLMKLVTPNRGVWLLLGVLPLLSMVFLMGQTWFEAPLHVLRALEVVVLGSLLAQALLYLYRERGVIVAGLAGNALLGLTYLVLAGTMVLLTEPERWSFVWSLLPLIFFVQAVVHMGMFSAASLALTGAGILFVYFLWSERRLPDDAPARLMTFYVGGAALMLGALGTPVMVVWNLFLAREPSLSLGIYGLAALVVVSMLVAAITCARSLLAGQVRHGPVVALFALFAFALVVLIPQRQQAIANQGHIAVLKQRAQWRRDKERASQESVYARATIDLAIGEQVYTAKCTACHTWDAKVVGPPYDAVVPRYFGKEPDLVAFINAPVKINPAYPPMPAQGLTEQEVVSVARYLLAEGAKRAGQDPAAVIGAASGADAGTDATADASSDAEVTP